MHTSFNAELDLFRPSDHLPKPVEIKDNSVVCNLLSRFFAVGDSKNDFRSR